MRSLKVIACFVGLLCWVIGCITPFEYAEKHFHRSQRYYEEGRKNRAAKEYNRIIRVCDEHVSDQSVAFLQAALYHHFYSIDLPLFWKQLDKHRQARWSLVSKLIKEYPENDKFLENAFAQIMKIEGVLKGNYPADLEQWLLIEKDIIVGEYIISKSKERDNLSWSSDTENRTITEDDIPVSFIDKVRSYAFYEVAKNFYLEAWIKTTLLVYENPSANLEPVMKLSRKGLKNTFWSLATLTRGLEYSDRSDEFTKLFKNQAHHYLEVMRRLEEFLNLPYPIGDSLSVEKIQEVLGVELEKDYLSLDGAFHMKEARIKVGMAVEEILTQKTTLTYQYFLDALKHIVLIRTLDWQAGLGSEYLVDNILKDIYLNLYRLSK